VNAAVAVVEQPGARTRTLLRDYVALTKPRVIVLLEVTTVFAMVVAAHGMPSLQLVVATLAGGWLSAGGANAINCWFDRDIDASMGRTQERPVPSGRIAPRAALTFGITLGALGFCVLALGANLLAASLATVALLFYVLVYTMWLKRSSPSNIVIGGAAGAIPPMVGWAAVTGHLSLAAIFMFAIIFYWTPPHFWALALLIRNDYERVRVPMLPVIAGTKETRQHIVLYTLLLVVVTVLPFLTRSFGWLYFGAALLLDAVFVIEAVRAVADPSAKSARRLFLFSMLYLALLFATMALDSVLITR